MPRLVTTPGIRAFEKHCLNDLLAGRSDPLDRASYQDAREDIALWMRSHFSDEELDLVYLAVHDVVAGDGKEVVNG